MSFAFVQLHQKLGICIDKRAEYVKEEKRKLNQAKTKVEI